MEALYYIFQISRSVVSPNKGYVGMSSDQWFWSDIN